MKTIRTVLITFGMTSLLYGGFALFCVSIDPPFASRSIYQMFRDTGFPILVIGIACFLAVLVISYALYAFRETTKSKGSSLPPEDKFLDEETVSVEEYERNWTPKLRNKHGAGHYQNPEAETENDIAEEDSDDVPVLDDSLFSPPAGSVQTQRCIFCGTSFPVSDPVCPKCGRHV